MFGRDIVVFEFVCFFISQVNYALHTRGDKYLPCTAAKNVSFRTGAQNVIQPLFQIFNIHLHNFQQLRDNSPGLLNQRQQNVFCVNLCMTVSLDYLSSPLSGFLRPLCKTIKSHHFLSILY